MTPKSIIALARRIINDNDPDRVFRQEDDELCEYVNQGIKECSVIAPVLFRSIGDMECVPGETEQGISFAEAQVFIEVLRVKGGRAVLFADMQTLSQFKPDWPSDAPGAAVNWFKPQGDPLRFYIYPAAPEGQIIEVAYIRNPALFGLDEEITDLPDSLEPVLAQYVISAAESKDDEHVNSGRAGASYQRFVSMLKPSV